MDNNINTIRKIKKKLENRLNKVFRGTGISIANRIIRESPVDTGRFRGNWQFTLNTPAFTTLDTTAKPNISWGNEVNIKDTMYLTNNLPYANVLEDGSSLQAPRGWVRLAVYDGDRALQEAISKINTDNL